MKYVILIFSLCLACNLYSQLEVRPICDDVTEMPTELSYSGFIIFDDDQDIKLASILELQVRVVTDTPNGNFIFTELHNVVTSRTGFFRLIIGENSSKDFQELMAYMNENPRLKYFLNVDVRGHNSNKFKNIGSKELLTVPYALVASVLGGNGKTGSHGASSDTPGPQGPQGPTGPPGPHAKVGIQGIQGAKGEDGFGIMQMQSTVPNSGSSNYYVDDGTNTADGQPHIRHFNGSNWIDL